MFFVHFDVGIESGSNELAIDRMDGVQVLLLVVVVGGGSSGWGVTLRYLIDLV